ncbi:hypothetical protein [Halosegnis sp.]|uniref:hypothetical protein n=1 Tax=Halosegnis sp. TaxID=2864959 RepID=UPI0035D46F3F
MADDDPLDGGDDPAHPITGTPYMLAAARASVPPTRLSELLTAAQTFLADRRDRYERQYEQPLATDDYETYLVDEGHWADVGERLDWRRRDHEAVARAHRQQLLHAGKTADRHAEFETALDLREAVVIGQE